MTPTPTVPRILACVAATAALSLPAAGCGGGSPGPASDASSSGTAAATGAVAFAHCMRSHGVPGWPDPESNGVFDKSKLRQLRVSPTRVRAIEDGPCNHLLPTGGSGSPDAEQQTRTRVADALSFARCMRTHGVTRFPDPTAQGDLTVEMVQAQGIDVHAPAVLHVVQTCIPASHGGITAAKVREALEHAAG